jgi:type II secretory pathway component GspD/PulD (secretin)
VLSGLPVGGGARPGTGREARRAWRASAAGRVAGGRDFTVAAHVPTHALLLRADRETLAVLQDVIDELDRRRPRSTSR